MFVVLSLSHGHFWVRKIIHGRKMGAEHITLRTSKRLKVMLEFTWFVLWIQNSAGWSPAFWPSQLNGARQLWCLDLQHKNTVCHFYCAIYGGISRGADNIYFGWCLCYNPLEALQLSRLESEYKANVSCRPGCCPEIPEILKFALKCPEIGVRSWNLYIYPQFFTRFHNFFKTHIILLILLMSK